MMYYLGVMQWVIKYLWGNNHYNYLDRALKILQCLVLLQIDGGFGSRGRRCCRLSVDWTRWANMEIRILFLITGANQENLRVLLDHMWIVSDFFCLLLYAFNAGRHLSVMTESELRAYLLAHVVLQAWPNIPDLTMTSGFSTIAGSVLAAYINLGVPPENLVTSSVMSIPASMAISKMRIPELEEPVTRGRVTVDRGVDQSKAPVSFFCPVCLMKTQRIIGKCTARIQSGRYFRRDCCWSNSVSIYVMF